MKIINDYGDVYGVFSLQELADIRHLISIAIWIRSWQLAQPNVIRLVRHGEIHDNMPPVEVDTRNLGIAACQADMVHGQLIWDSITRILEKADAFPAIASWRKDK